jgi:hypothetical protein
MLLARLLEGNRPEVKGPFSGHFRAFAISADQAAIEAAMAYFDLDWSGRSGTVERLASEWLIGMGYLSVK